MQRRVSTEESVRWKDRLLRLCPNRPLLQLLLYLLLLVGASPTGWRMVCKGAQEEGEMHCTEPRTHSQTKDLFFFHLFSANICHLISS